MASRTLLICIAAFLGYALAASACTGRVHSDRAQAETSRAGRQVEPAFGPNVYVFTPAMPESQIQARVDSIAAQQLPNQFGSARYALLFEPGTYGSATNPLIFQVGYYTQVAGLGASPAEVTINGSIDVYNQCFGAQCTALNNFWRSLSNLTIDVGGGLAARAAPSSGRRRRQRRFDESRSTARCR